MNGKRGFQLVVRVFLVVLVLAVAAGGAWAWEPANPSDGPGPHYCWAGSNSGPQGGNGGCKSGSCNRGAPADEINTFTGNLTISDIPVWYKAVGGTPAFEVMFNSQSGQSGPLGDRWTHRYNIKVVDNGTDGATVIEGNGWEHEYSTTSYLSPVGIFDTLTKTYSGSTWTGWKLTRPSGEELYFDTGGKLTKITDSDGLNTTLTYSSGLLTTITDPLGRQTTLTYSGGLLTKVTVPGGLYATFQYDSHSPNTAARG